MNKKPSTLVMGLFQDFIADQPPLGAKLKAEYKSYYGFVPTKGSWGPFAAPFLTTEHLAQAFDVSLKTLERWRIKGGGPPYIKVGNQIRYPVAELDNWVRDNLNHQD